MKVDNQSTLEFDRRYIQSERVFAMSPTLAGDHVVPRLQIAD